MWHKSKNVYNKVDLGVVLGELKHPLSQIFSYSLKQLLFYTAHFLK